MGSSCSAAAPEVAEKEKRQESVCPDPHDGIQFDVSEDRSTISSPMSSETASDHLRPLPQLESPTINPLTAMVPSRRSSVSSRPSSSITSSRRGSSVSPRSDGVPRNLRRFLSDSDMRHGSLSASDRTNIYVQGDVPDLNMLPVASAIADFTDSEVQSTSSWSSKADSLPTPHSASLPDSRAGSIV